MPGLLSSGPRASRLREESQDPLVRRCPPAHRHQRTWVSRAAVAGALCGPWEGIGSLRAEM